jgi:hypothetical protein
MLNSLIGYFDINSNLRAKRAEAVGPPNLAVLMATGRYGS